MRRELRSRTLGLARLLRARPKGGALGLLWQKAVEAKGRGRKRGHPGRLPSTRLGWLSETAVCPAAVVFQLRSPGSQVRSLARLLSRPLASCEGLLKNTGSGGSEPRPRSLARLLFTASRPAEVRRRSAGNVRQDSCPAGRRTRGRRRESRERLGRSKRRGPAREGGWPASVTCCSIATPSHRRAPSTSACARRRAPRTRTHTRERGRNEPRKLVFTATSPRGARTQWYTQTREHGCAGNSYTQREHATGVDGRQTQSLELCHARGCAPAALPLRPCRPRALTGTVTAPTTVTPVTAAAVAHSAPMAWHPDAAGTRKPRARNGPRPRTWTGALPPSPQPRNKRVSII